VATPDIPTGTEGWTVRLDWIVCLLIVTGALIFLFGTVFIGTETSTLANGAITIMLVGLTFSSVFRTYTRDLNLSKKELAQITTWTFISMGAVLAINFATPPLSQLPLVGFDPRQFAVLIAISEETFFRLFLLPWLYRLTRIALLAVFLCASLFAIFHLKMYGGDTKALIIVLGGGVILSYATLETRRLTPATLGHCLINFLAA